MIYFIQSGEFIKIGITTKIGLKGRMRSLQTSNPNKLTLLCTTDGSIKIERLVHKKFSHLRVSGEWFKISPELSSFINVIKDHDGYKITSQIRDVKKFIKEFGWFEVDECIQILSSALRKRYTTCSR